MIDRINMIFATGSLVLALTMFLAPGPVSAGAGGGGEGECTAFPSQGLCCECVGVGPEPENGSKFCTQGDPGQGGTDWCNDEVCPFDDPPCGLDD